MKSQKKKAKTKREFHWTNFKNPLPTSEEEARKWENLMIEDANRMLLPMFQH